MERTCGYISDGFHFNDIAGVARGHYQTERGNVTLESFS